MGRKPSRHYSVESDAFWSKPARVTHQSTGAVFLVKADLISQELSGAVANCKARCYYCLVFKALVICKPPHSPLLNSPLDWERLCNGKGFLLKSRKANCRGGDFSLSKWSFNLMTWMLPPCICLEWMAKLGILSVFFNKPFCSYFKSTMKRITKLWKH